MGVSFDAFIKEIAFRHYGKISELLRLPFDVIFLALILK